MKNNTKIRLHLSKNLFESIAKEVLAESNKMNMSGGAYTEAVKMPKAKKSPEVKATNKMKTMDEMEINVAEGMDVLQPGDNVTWLDGHQKEYKGTVQSQEGGDYYKVKITVAPPGGHSVGDIITKQSGDVKKAEGIKEYVGVEQTTGLITALASLLGIGVPLATTLYKDLKGKNKQEKAEVLKKIAGSVGGAAGAHLQKKAPSEDTTSLNELRKKTNK